MLYWSFEIANNKNSSLVFTSNDYSMAEWMKTNLTSTDNSNNWTLTRWDLGYLYGYISGKPIFASPNLCNYLFPSQFSITTDVDYSYQTLKENHIHYVLLKFSDFSRFYSDVTKVNGVAPQVMQATINNQYYYLIHENYYLDMSSRLFNFNGASVSHKTLYYIKNNSLVGTDNYDEGVLYAQGGNIYGIDEMSSPVDISSTNHFKLIHSEGTGTDAIKLFEVID